jgi:hypothetical protein
MNELENFTELGENGAEKLPTGGTLDKVGERTPDDVLHREEGATVVRHALTIVGNDTWVGQQPSRSPLAFELSDHMRVVREFLACELDDEWGVAVGMSGQP